MMCVDCLREDSTIQPGEHVVAEFNPWEGSTGRMFYRWSLARGVRQG